MKKWKQIVLVAALALLLGMTTKAESQAAGIMGVKQTDAGTSSIDISCNSDLSAKYYVLFVSNDPSNLGVEKDYSTNPNSLSANGLTAGSTYYVRVRGALDYDWVDSLDNRTYEWCTDLSAPVEVVTAPDNTNTKLVQTGATNNSVTMQITGSAGANYYILGTSGVYSSAQVLAASDQPTLTVGSLPANTQLALYGYACRKAASTGFIAHTSYDCGADYSVKTLTGKINTKNFGVSNAWSNINSYTFAVSSGFNADGYQFQFQNVKGKVKKEVLTASNSVGVSDFINGTFYKYRVRSYVDCGIDKKFGEWSDFRYIGVPKDVNGVSRTRGKKRTLSLSWKKVSGASKYIVYISKSEKGGYKKVKTLSPKKRSLKITKCGKKKLKKNTTYYVKLVVKGKVGKKTVSSDVTKIMTSNY